MAVLKAAGMAVYWVDLTAAQKAEMKVVLTVFHSVDKKVVCWVELLAAQKAALLVAQMVALKVGLKVGYWAEKKAGNWVGSMAD